MMTNPLGHAELLEQMAAAIPTHQQGDETSDVSSSLDAIALFTHACMAKLGFRLLGFNEDKRMETECQSMAPRLPSQWNASTSSHSFVYAHTQSAMQFVIKVDRMGSKAEIRGLAVGAERIHRFEIVPRDYISSAALPVRMRMTSDGVEDRTDLPEKLRKVFISEERMTDLTSLLKTQLIQRLIPNLQKDGYQEDADDVAARQDADEAGRGGARPRPADPHPLPPNVPRPHPYGDPLEPPPRRPIPAGDFPPPDFEDEYEINRPPRGGRGGANPFDIGHRDLYPPGLGPHDPLRGSFVPPGGGLPRPGGSGGMHPTFDDPLFGGPGGGDGDEFDPQAPPGARWDPLGPGGVPRLGGNRRGGGGPFGGFGGGFGGDII